MQLLDDFIDGELAEIKHREVKQHINECDKCDREAEFLSSLSHDAASLPQSIQPDKDLWPGIEAKIIAAPFSNDDGYATEGKNSWPKYRRYNAAAWGWRIAAAAVLCSLVLAGTYLGMRKQTARYANQGVSSNAVEKQLSGPARLPSTHSLDNRSGMPSEKMTGTTAGRAIRSVNNQEASILTYPLDPTTAIFVSNYGIYGLRLEMASDLDALRYYVVRFDQSGKQSWIPPLPPYSRPYSLYPGGGNRLWMAYAVQQSESRTFIAELDFGAESQIKNIWEGGTLQIQKFVISPQGLIYAAGLRNDYSKAVSRLTKGQSITAELMHIIDPATGEERHFFPMTIRPKFDTPNWVGQTQLETIALIPAIAVKSNGNFFLTVDRSLANQTVRDLIKNEAVEYSPDGTVARTWMLGTLESNAYLNRIFVDVDDSILAEILRYPDAGTADATEIADRYLLKIDLDGKVTRYQPSFTLEERIQGWSGQTRDLVTLVPGPLAPGKQTVIRIHRLAP